MIHPDGVYFGMPEAEYHEDPALGGTAHKDLLVNPVQAQWKRLPQLRDELGMGPTKVKGDGGVVEDTTAKQFGSAVHTICLEGRDVFAERYAVDPEPPDGLLCTKDQIRAALGDLCDLPKNAALLDYVRLARIHKAGPLQADWDAAKAEIIGERTEISRRWQSTMNLIDTMMDMKRESRGGVSIREKVLVNGQPEVSVFWTDDTGLRLKARIDYLRIPATVDLKTFAAREGLEIVDAFALAVKTYAYDMQAAHYQDARAQLPKLDRFNCPDHAWMDKVCAFESPAWVWLTVQTLGMPEVDTLELPNHIVFDAAWSQVQRAREKYRTYAAKFGEDQPWVTDRPHIVMVDEIFNSNITGRGAEKWTT